MYRVLFDVTLTPSSRACQVSPNGLMNSDTMVKFLYHADTYFPVERPVLLLYNGQSPHIFSQIIHVARQMGIVLFVMPPYATNSQMSSDMNYFIR